MPPTVRTLLIDVWRDQQKLECKDSGSNYVLCFLTPQMNFHDKRRRKRTYNAVAGPPNLTEI
eukprot:gene15782-22323_t